MFCDFTPSQISFRPDRELKTRGLEWARGFGGELSALSPKQGNKRKGDRVNWTWKFNRRFTLS